MTLLPEAVVYKERSTSVLFENLNAIADVAGVHRNTVAFTISPFMSLLG